MSLRRSASKTGKHPRRVWIPIRRAQSRERRDKNNPVRIGNRKRQLLALGHIGDELKSITHPLDRRSGNEGASFNSVSVIFFIERPSHRRDQPVTAFYRLAP